MDYAISNWILKTFGDSKFFAMLSRVLTYFGSTWTIVAILTGLLIFKKTRKIGFYATISVLVCLLLNNLILKNIVQRERPFEEYASMKQICDLAGYKYPTGFSMASGHATISMTLAVSVFMFAKKSGAFAIAGSVVIGLTRVCLLVHFMTDVLVGWAIGTLVAVGIYYLLNLIIKKYNKKEGKNENNNSGIGEQPQN